jgi:hypothetical protein
MGGAIDSIERSTEGNEELRTVARAVGLQIDEKGGAIPAIARPRVPLFERWAWRQNGLSGTIDGVEAAMFGLTTLELLSRPGAIHRYTVIQFAQPDLPVFVCVPRTSSAMSQRWTVTPMNFDRRGLDPDTLQTVSAFERACVLGLGDRQAASDEGAVRGFFCAPRLAGMVQHAGWHVQTTDRLLIFAVDGIAALADWPALWHEANELRRALLAPVSSAFAPIPAAPGMDVDRRRNRFNGRFSGSLAGGVLGFIGAGVAFATFMVSQMGLGRPGSAHSWAIDLFPVVVSGGALGGLLTGAFGGWWLGGAVADLRYRPKPKGTRPRKMGWIVGGAFVGWAVGVLIGLGLLLAFAHGERPTWLGLVLFLSSPILCLFLGGLVGLGLARRRAAQQAGE